LIFSNKGAGNMKTIIEIVNEIDDILIANGITVNIEIINKIQEKVIDVYLLGKHDSQKMK